MKKSLDRTDVLHSIQNIEHPEIAETLMNLGMILDVAVDTNIVTIAMALPMFDIPSSVRNILVDKLRGPIEALGRELRIEFFEMTTEVKEKFFQTAKKRWKGYI